MRRRGQLSEQKEAERSNFGSLYLQSFSIKYLVMVLKEKNKRKYDDVNCGGLKTCLCIL